MRLCENVLGMPEGVWDSELPHLTNLTLTQPIEIFILTDADPLHKDCTLIRLFEVLREFKRL